MQERKQKQQGMKKRKNNNMKIKERKGTRERKKKVVRYWRHIKTPISTCIILLKRLCQNKSNNTKYDHDQNHGWTTCAI